MKKIIPIIITVFIIIFAGIGFMLANQKYKNPSYNTIIFATVVSTDKNSSVSEKEEASQFLAETVIGWTHSPQFVQNLGFKISAKKQERQNIIIEFNAKNLEISKEYAQKVMDLLRKKISDYNKVSETQFDFLFENPVTSQNSPQKYMWGIAGGILGLFLGCGIGELILRRERTIN